MNIRKDLDEVAPYIARLLAISKEFQSNCRDWSHLKTQEDFRLVHQIPYNEKYKVEAVYSDGRDMANYMSETLAGINYDFTRFPTLTTIIDGFNEGWVNGAYDPGVPDLAIETCKLHDLKLWSVDQMAILFKKQERLLAAVRVTLGMLKNSDLYKLENGLEIMSDKQPSIHVSGVTGSSIIINSDNASATVTQTYNEPEIFGDMISAVKAAGLEEGVTSLLVDNTQMLAASHESGSFGDAYKDFMQNVSAHITVFTPFIAGLAALL